MFTADYSIPRSFNLCNGSCADMFRILSMYVVITKIQDVSHDFIYRGRRSHSYLLIHFVKHGPNWYVLCIFQYFSHSVPFFESGIREPLRIRLLIKDFFFCFSWNVEWYSIRFFLFESQS